MYNVINVQIKKNHPLYGYCVEMSKLSTNLFNAALFRQRQWLTSQNKEILTENELQVIKEVDKTISKFGLNKPCKIMSYNFIEKLMRATDNPDFFAGLPMQTAQQVLKEVKNDLISFFKSLAEFKKCPEKFTAKPKLTSYKTKKSLSTFVLTNQDCVIYKSKKNKHYCKFPLTKQIVNLGSKIEGKLKQVTVTPMHGVFQLAFVMENNVQTISKPVKRICALDPGVNNLLAVTNNCGLDCLLFNGKPLKAKNQYYNKKIAEEMSRQTKVTKTKFKPNKEYNRLTLKRNNQVKDYMFKTARCLINWCLKNNIDTIVAGKNKYWKQETNQGDSNNQNFVLIPHAKLYLMIKNLCERYGINYVEQEESYTSKASFLDNDYIPTYGVDDENAKFSGRRVHRGLYRSSDGIKINADLNGSANILRKFCGEVFEINFNQILKVNPQKGVVVVWTSLLTKETPSESSIQWRVVHSSWTGELAKRLSHVSKIDEDGDEVRKINWNMLSRKDKKYLKLEIKHRLKAFHKQFETFNKYCGRDDVLYIHARIGGNNWNYYDGPKLMEQPWFMEKVDDSFDSTYCDIYAKIKPVGETIDYDADGNRIINYSYEKDNKKIRVTTCSELDDDGNLTGLYHQEISLYVDDKLHTKINQGNDYKTCDEVFNFFERCMTVRDTKETVLINQEIIFNDERYSNETTYQYQNAEGTCAVCQELYTDKSGKPDEITYSLNSKEVKSLPEYIMNDIENSKETLKESDRLINEFENAGYLEKIAK